MFVKLQGTGFRIFSYPTPDLLVAGYFNGLGAVKDSDFEERIRKQAKKVLDAYYAKYSERFKNIGHPADIKKKLDGWREQDLEEEKQRLAGERSE